MNFRRPGVGGAGRREDRLEGKHVKLAGGWLPVAVRGRDWWMLLALITVGNLRAERRKDNAGRTQATRRHGKRRNGGRRGEIMRRARKERFEGGRGWISAGKPCSGGKILAGIWREAPSAD